MAEIHVLDTITIDQIAAGEVIERPVSVVKELVENALDAGADSITVELAEGGLSLIRVTDNGCGIPSDQVELAFERHATSKILSAEDLFDLHSLGFRGEALSSIASVARVELITRTESAENAVRFVIEGGKKLSLEETGAPLGTSFFVRDLFYNTPVRRKFLKSAQTEASYVATLMEQLCLSRSGIAMKLIVNGQVKLQTNGSYKMRDVLFTLYGRQTASQLQPVNYEEKGMKLVGYIGLPALSRGNRSSELTFINGRFVKSALMMKAIEQAYHGLTMQHKFPMAVLQLFLDASLVDVNVHPTKMEVRFRSEKDVFDIIYHGIRETLFSGNQVPAVEPGPETREKNVSAAAEEAAPSETLHQPEQIGTEPASAAEQAAVPAVSVLPPTLSRTEEPSKEERMLREEPRPTKREENRFSYRADEDRRLLEQLLFTEGSAKPQEARLSAPVLRETQSSAENVTEAACPAVKKPDEKPGELTAPAEAPVIRAEATEQLSLFGEKILKEDKLSSFRLIGQVFDTYWLMEYEDQFLLADQHAVHEKILFERTMKALADKTATTQLLNPPLFLSLTAQQQLALTKTQAALEEMGFEVNSLGGREYSISAVPDNLFSLSPEEVLIEMLDEIAEERGAGSRLIEDKVALMSCKAAVKGNNKLSFAEAEELLKELLRLDNPYCCPHGRPTVIRMSKTDLEKKFKRIV